MGQEDIIRLFRIKSNSGTNIQISVILVEIYQKTHIGKLFTISQHYENCIIIMNAYYIGHYIID